MTSSLIPRPTRFEVTRPTLLTRLAESLDTQVVVLAAPSGYGKSTLLAQYARSTPRPTIWCRLTETHAGPLEVTSLIAANAQAHIGTHEKLLHPDPHTPDHVLMNQLAQALATADVNIDLILDPVGDDQLARWLIELALSLEEGHRVMISRYSAEGLKLARPVANGQAIILDAADLQFSPAETAALLESRAVTPSASVVDQLQGWPAGLALLAAGTQRHVHTQDLVRESLDGLAGNIRSVLADLSVLDIWSEEDARQLDIPLPDGWLAKVQRSGLPLLPLGQQQFQPHQLLLTVLEQELQRDVPHRQRLHLAAAALAERRDQIRRAVRLYAHAGAYADFLRLAAPLTAHFRGRGEHRFIREILALLPVDRLPHALRARLAWALIETGDSTEGETILHDLRQAGELSPAGFASLAMLYGRRGDVDQQYRYAMDGMALLSPGSVEPALSWPFVYAALKRGQLADARTVAGSMMVWAHDSGDQVRLAEAWQLQALVARHGQDIPASRQALEEARNIYNHLGWTIRAAMIRLDEADLAFRTGDFAAALMVLKDAPATIDGGHHLYHARRLLLDATLDLWTGELARASEGLDKAEAHAQAGQLRQQQQDIQLTRADLLIAQECPEQARGLLTKLQPSQPMTEAYRCVLVGLLPGEIFTANLETVRAWVDASVQIRGLALLSRQHPELVAEMRLSPFWTRLPENQKGRPESPGKTLLPGPHPALATDRPLLLEVMALGDSSARLNQQQVPIALAKSRELLVWLALHNSGTRDEIVTALWDGSAEERHVEYFRVAVRRLRGGLKVVLTGEFDPLPYKDGRYRLSPELQVQLDANPGLALPTDLSALQTQFRAYQQLLMPGVETEWIQDLRERCHHRAIALGLELARVVGAGAPAVYQEVLQLDPWSDAARQGLIHALIHLQRRAEAEQALRSYAQMLRDEFNTTPDAGFLREMTQSGLGPF